MKNVGIQDGLEWQRKESQRCYQRNMELDQDNEDTDQCNWRIIHLNLIISIKLHKNRECKYKFDQKINNLFQN